MKRKDDEFMAEIYLRAGALTKQRKRRKAFVLAIGCCVSVFCLSSVIFHLAGESLPSISATVFVENSSVGGYILTGMLSFTSGVVVSLLSIRRQRKNKGGSQDENE